MRTVGVELRRLFARRATWMLCLAAVLIALLLAFTFWYSSKPPPPDVAAAQQQAYQSAIADWNRNKISIIQDCLDQQAQQRQIDPTFDGGCTEANLKPKLEQFTTTAPALADSWEAIWRIALAGIAGFIAYILAATFIGAEFATGNISTWLTFEARRGRVYATKLIAGAIGALFIFVVETVVLLGGTALALWLNKGDMSLTRHVIVAGALPALGWSAVAVAGAGVIGGALTFVFRRSIAVVGIVIGYIIVVEGILPTFVDSLQRWLVTVNLPALITGKVTYSTWVCNGTGPCSEVVHTVTRTWAGAEFGAVLLVALIAGWLVFRRREMTM